MLFKDALSQIKGIRFIAENIPLHSSAGRRLLYETPFIAEENLLRAEYEKIGELVSILKTLKETPDFGLHALKDIRSTLDWIKKKYTLGDIELFEVKELALLALRVRDKITSLGISVVNIPDTSEIVKLLDPENTGIPQFYIYDLYDKELAEIRQQIRNEKEEGCKRELREKELELEDGIREKISQSLFLFSGLLSETLESLARLDLLLGKAVFALRFNLVKPDIVKGSTVYEGLCHLELKQQLEEKSLRYQPVDVTVEPDATIITGANMAGKSMLLKSLMLAQYMAQFGLWIPAAIAKIVLVEEILVSIGDEQDEQKGLSSFAAEMLNINRIIKAARNQKILALVDEPARTTNPEEGKAIVSALVEMLNQYHVLSMVTTHYSGLQLAVRRLRVKGLMHDKIDSTLSVRNINNLIDYTLIEDKEENVPHEALRIAELLNIDEELINTAHLFLNANDTKK